MNNKYLLSDLVARLQKKGYDAKQADLLTRSFFHCLEKGLEQDEVVKINQFGQFKLQKVDARQSVDVNTGARVEIKAHSKISFLPDAYLKDLVNAPLAHLQPVVIENAEKASQASLPEQEIPVQASEEIKVAATQTPETAAIETPEKPSNMTEMKKQDEKALFEVQDTEESKSKETKKKKNGWLLILCLVAIALIIYAMLAKERKKEVLQESATVEQVAQTPAPQATPTTTEASAQPAQQDVLDPSAWPTLKEVSLAKGERLTLLALENYGAKVFWVYIYEANKKTIANPNDIKAGTTIRIPQLPVGLINAKSTECMAKAKALEDKYNAQFSK